MKKSKIFISIISISLAFAVLLLVFNPSGLADVTAFESKETGLKTRITEFGESLFGKSKNESEKNVTDSNNLPENTTKNTQQKVFIGGTPIGIKLYCDGVVVVGMDDVLTNAGTVNPAKNAGFKKGDIIKSVDGKTVTKNSEVSFLIEESNGKEMLFTVNRDGAEIQINFKSVYSDTDGRYKAGLWIRDSSAGIGTLTFFTDEGYFATLGHAVCDIDTGKIMPLSSGEATAAIITGVFKGKEGTAGELNGVLEHETKGRILSNESIGVYGILNAPDKTGKSLFVAEPSEVAVGKAQIISTVQNGITEYYDIEITKIDINSTESKNFVIKVTDAALIEKTGGIVQGMSGSPIIQNGKLVGAVTHVFVNDPTGGYGIFSATMLERINQLK